MKKSDYGFVYVFHFPVADEGKTLARMVNEHDTFGVGTDGVCWIRSEKHCRDKHPMARAVIEVWTGKLVKDSMGAGLGGLYSLLADKGIDVDYMLGETLGEAYAHYCKRRQRFTELHKSLAAHGLLIEVKPEVDLDTGVNLSPQAAAVALLNLEAQINDMQGAIALMGATSTTAALGDLKRMRMLAEAGQEVRRVERRKAAMEDHLYVQVDDLPTHVNALPEDERALAVATAMSDSLTKL